jgi:hypothetical protein
MTRILSVAVLTGALLLATRPAAAIERNFAGSAQLDYHWVPSQKSTGPRSTFDGFTSEVALKVAVDVSERLSANVKACHGCHGFELPMAYFDYRLADELNIRAGRFSPSFGAFNLRHDPANHATSSNPLPYDMGRMLRKNEWNLGVLPSPFPDNGVEINGTHWFGEGAQLDYAVYAVSGFKAGRGSLDLDWTQSYSRAAYLVDNNGSPAFGARLALTLRTGDSSDFTIGGSAMRGKYDPENRFSYTIGGIDLSARWGGTYLRLEYLVRHQSFETDPLQAFKLPLDPSGRQTFDKHGYYLELEHALTESVSLLARADGLYRKGNVPVDSPLGPKSAIFRYTAGATFAIQPGLRLKASGELWAFSEDPPAHQELEASFHLALVGTF